MFSNIIGQELVKRTLSGAIRQDRLYGSYLFSGPEGVGKWATALEVAKILNCQQRKPVACGNCSSCRKINNLIHPDIKLLFPLPSTKTEEEKERFSREKIEEPYSVVGFSRSSNISVEAIRQMQKELSLRPFEARRRMVIIYQAEKMASSGENSLLKTLEEPPLDAVVIMISSESGKLLPTISSRCQKIRFSCLSGSLIENYLKSNYQLDSAKAGFYSKIARGSLGKAISLINSERSQIREDGVNLVFSALNQDLCSVVMQVQEMIAQYDRDSVLEMFDFLFTLFRDIYLYLEQHNDSGLLNLDLKKRITELAGSFGNSDVAERGMNLISKTKEDCIKRNANLELSLLAVVLNLRKWPRRSLCQKYI